MALIKCPECGRENVSDSAEMCPSCGYGIKAHFELIKEAEEKKRLEDERLEAEKEKIVEQKKIEDEVDIVARKTSTLKFLREKEKNEKSSVLKIGIWSMAWTILLILCFMASENGSLGILIVIAFFCGGLGWFVFLSDWITLNTTREDIYVAERDMGKYDKRIEQRRQNEIAIAQKAAQQQAIKHPKCPNCGSNNTQRISTANRATSIAMTGLASSKIGKQYECKKCKHKW